jgi:hypothetical protein
LEKGLSEALQINIDELSHHQILDSEQIPFKCNICHVYGHFAKNCQNSRATFFKAKVKRRTQVQNGLKILNIRGYLSQRRGQLPPTPQTPQEKLQNCIWHGRQLHTPPPHPNISHLVCSLPPRTALPPLDKNCVEMEMVAPREGENDSGRVGHGQGEF